MKTFSEQLFEEYCVRTQIPCQRIVEGGQKTPDYELTLQDQPVIAEVKEIRRNKEERESDRLLARRGYGNVLSATPGDRVRKKIAASSAQIKVRTQGIYPSILVLFDHGQVFGHCDPYHIRVAMYGLEQVHIALPPIAGPTRPYATGMSYGPKRKMTATDNNSISAIGVLVTPGPNEIGLHVYHNEYAEVPLDPGLLARYAVRQFELEDEAPGTTAKWRELTC